MVALTRRSFSRAALAVGMATLADARRVLGASDRVRLGLIGVGNRGDQLLDAFLSFKDAEIVAICDLYQPYLDFAARKIGTHPKQFRDYRKLLELKDLDAVVISTPDHWHALQTIHACQVGKDVYVEKPLSLCVAEGRRMVEAARRYGRVAQVGLNRRSSALCKQAVDFIRSGGIGKVTVIRSFHIQNEWPMGIGNPSDQTPPADFDWDAWLGPAPWVQYNKNRAFYRFRWFYHYSGGQLTNFGAHFLDIVHWVLGQEAPLGVAAMGGKLALEDNREVPDTLEAMWTYPGGTLVTFSQFNASAAPAAARDGDLEFRGTKGTMYLGYTHYEVVPEEITGQVFPALNPLDRSLSRRYRTGRKPMIESRKREGDDGTALHARNFLDSIRSRGRCNCDMETGHRSTTATLIANIAHKTQSYLKWDAQTERFTNNEEANKYLSYEYRPPHRLPEV